MKFFFVSVIATLFLSSCTTPVKQKPFASISDLKPEDMRLLEDASSKKAVDATDADRKALQNALVSLEEFCTPRLASLERDAENRSKKAFWLSVAGALSGAVVGPALAAGNASANSAAIAAFSGFGGSTNFLSQSLDSSGLSGSSDAKTRNKVVEAIWEKLKIAFDEQKTIGERISAVDAAKAGCVFYSIHVPSVPASTSD